jgi:gas vesicle protein
MQEDREGLGFGSGLLVGVGLGLILGILFAPQAGEATQEQLMERSRFWKARANAAMQSVGDLADQAMQTDAWQRGSAVVNDPEHPLGRAVAEGRDRIRRTQRDIETKLAGMGAGATSETDGAAQA